MSHKRISHKEQFIIISSRIDCSWESLWSGKFIKIQTPGVGPVYCSFVACFSSISIVIIKCIGFWQTE